MTDKMKKILRNTGWLVMAAARKAVGGVMMAAALTLGMTACSSENDLAEEPTPQTAVTAQTIHVTVGAGIGDGTATRAMVEQDGTTRTLKFTAGDKLWIDGQKHIEEGDYWYNIQGQLAIGTIGTDGTTAEFSGDLTVSKWKESDPDLDLSSLEGLFATLIPAGSTCIKVETYPNGHMDLISEPRGIATGELNALMATNTEVSGTFADASNVTLKARTAFFNCTVTDLDPSTAYDVSLNKGDEVSVTTDGDGNLHFLAWFYLNNESGQGVPYDDIHDLRFYIGTNKRVSLGDKTLYAKVYNVTRAAETYTPFTVIDNTTNKEVEPEYGSYSFKEGNADITVSGQNEGQIITLWGSDRVVLSGVTATCGDAIINEENSEGTLNVELSGANSITITDPMYGGRAINSNGYLYLSGNGTLTVTVTATDYYGLMGRNYQPSDGPDPATNTDASVLAASGYTVTRSACSGNETDGYTWTYTVAPVNQ